MKKIFILQFSVFISLNGIGQIINNKPVDIAMGLIDFNSELVKKNRIKKIDITIVDKPDGNIIIDKGARRGYEFNENGYVSKYYYTIFNRIQSEEVLIPAIKKNGRIIKAETIRNTIKYINDTIFINAYYDNQNRIITKRVKSGEYFDTFYYEYNGKGQMIKKLHFKETNISENKNEFILGVQNELSSEFFNYEMITLAQTKIRCINDEGREYKKVIINFDDDENVLSKTHEFIVSWMRQESTYKYDENGKLLKKTFETNESNEIKEYSLFEYDKSGALLTEIKFKDNVLSNEINYLYDESNTFIKSEVNRDHTNASIVIVKYSYTFYNNFK